MEMNGTINSCIIRIFDDYLQFNDTVIKGYLYHELLLILQSGKIPTELIKVLPSKIDVKDHRHHQDYHITLEPSLAAQFQIMESNSSSHFDMFMKESESLKAIQIDLSNNDTFDARNLAYFEKHKFNCLSKKPRIEKEEAVATHTTDQPTELNLNLMCPANNNNNTSFMNKLNPIKEYIANQHTFKATTIEENQVKSINGFVIVQSIKFKHNVNEIHCTINLTSSQSKDYFEAVLYFGKFMDTTLNGFSTKVAIGPRNAISTTFQNLINNFNDSWHVVFDSKLNINSPPQSRATPEIEEKQQQQQRQVILLLI